MTVSKIKTVITGELQTVTGMRETKHGKSYVVCDVKVRDPFGVVPPGSMRHHVFGCTPHQADRLDRLIGKMVSVEYHVNDGIGEWEGELFNVVDRVGSEGKLVWRK